MHTFSRLICLTILSFFSFCSSPQYANPDDAPATRLSFGSGGGVTGFVTEYILLQNGQLFKKQSTQDNYEALDRVDKNQVKQIFDNYKFLKIQDIQHDHPGNRYYFLQHQEADMIRRITWGDAAHPVDPNVELFYGILQQLTKSKN